MSLKRNAETSGPTTLHKKRVKYGKRDDREKDEPIPGLDKGIQDTPKALPPLLTLSDEILLFILRFLDPRDVINLGRSCVRLSGVVRDRALWSRVDLRAAPPLMLCQLGAFLPYLHGSTKAVLSRGLAPLPPCKRRSTQPLRVPPLARRIVVGSGCSYGGASTNTGAGSGGTGSSGGATAKSTTPKWEPRRCAPAFVLRDLADSCPNLETLHLERHVFDAGQVSVTDFPSSITKLVLDGCELFHIARDRSYFHGINKHLVHIQELVLDGCLWLSAECLMGISKCTHLRKLSLRYCRNVGACYAYISLSARFGFKALEELDVRGTALGDHEIPCFQSISSLTHLYIEAPQAWPPVEYSYHSPSCTNSVHPMFACALKEKQPSDTDNSGKLDAVISEDEKACPKAARCVCLGERRPRRPKARPFVIERAPPGFAAAMQDRALSCVAAAFGPAYSCRFGPPPEGEEDDSDEREEGVVYGARGDQRDPREEELAAQLRGGSGLVSDEGLLSLGTRFVLELQNANPRPPPPARPLVRNPRLRHLSVTNCAHVTDLTLAHLSLHQPLRHVDIRGCGVTARGVADFQGLRPDVELIHDHDLPDRDPSAPIPAPQPVVVFPAPPPAPGYGLVDDDDVEDDDGVPYDF